MKGVARMIKVLSPKDKDPWTIYDSKTMTEKDISVNEISKVFLNICDTSEELEVEWSPCEVERSSFIFSVEEGNIGNVSKGLYQKIKDGKILRLNTRKKVKGIRKQIGSIGEMFNG
jgi:hypothetical protein